jgi:phosphoglycolate phosphatase
MAIRLVIFDLDGTLIDSIADITNALNHALRPYSTKILASEEVAGMVGEGAKKLVQKVMAKYNLVLDVEEVVKSYNDNYSACLTDNTTIYAGVMEALEDLKDYRKALVSNKSEAFSRRILKGFGLEKYFDMVVCADTLPERKPSPVPILHVMTALGVRPEDALIVGDSEVDILAGKASYVKTVAVTHGYGRPGFQEDADFVITTLSQLKDVVRNIP